MPDQALTVITPCFNDFKMFQATLDSLRDELDQCDELVVVDSSQDKNRARILLEKGGLKCQYRYVWTVPRGVYPAFNEGLRQSTSPWIQIINSGDLLLPGGRDQIRKAIQADHHAQIHVFALRAGDPKGANTVFRPSPHGIWPFQSIIASRAVFENLGFYDEELKVASDQIFFAFARRECTWRFHEFVLTQYDLFGISSRVSLKISGELYQMWRALGRNPLISFVKAYTLPFVRLAAEKAFGAGLINRAKFAILPRYTTTKREGIGSDRR